MVYYEYNSADGSNIRHDYSISTRIYIQNDYSAANTKPYTLSQTIHRLLTVTPMHKLGEANKFTFDPAQAEEYSTVESPEFSFEGNTLFEALNFIAGYKGAFPALKDGVVSFKKMWNGVYLTESDLPAPIEEVSSSDMNQYCTFLDTEVQNLVGVNDSQVGSVVEPYAGGWKTTRSVSGSEISQDTAIIATDYPVYLLTKLEIGYIGDVMPENGDLTAYAYESGDYNALSDTTASYPYSKAYALKWTQGAQNITELSHRINAATGFTIVQAFQDPALSNIVYAKTGDKTDSGIVTWIKQLLDLKNGYGFADLMFRTTYIPMINARVKQYKTYFGEFGCEGSLKYNQTAELVDSEMYGKHLKELVRKLGNSVKRCIYIFRRIDDVPKVGTVVDGWSVYDVGMTISENRVVATISYVKYAELSQYIGVRNPWKDSDVSQDKWSWRKINYSEFMLFTHDGTKTGTSGSWSEAGLQAYLPFAGTETDVLTCVKATGYMEGAEEGSIGAACNTVILPVISLSGGSSILFHWQYENNYSAGQQSQEAPDGATDRFFGTRYNRAQKSVRYADSRGRIETYNFELKQSANYTKSNTAWVARSIGNSVPELPTEGTDEFPAYFSVENLLIQKDSGEALSFDVQIHNYSDNEHFIIGSGLTNFCPLIGGAGSVKETGLYGFSERLTIFDGHVSLSGATRIGDAPQPSYDSENNKLTISLSSEINLYKAWAIVLKDKNDNHQIVFGENKPFDGSNFKTALYIVPQSAHE